MTDAEWVKILAGLLGTIIVGAVCYWLGGKGKQTTVACAACREACQKDMREWRTLIERAQENIAAEVATDVKMLFRMVRSLLIHSTIPEAEKERILNDRSAI